MLQLRQLLQQQLPHLHKLPQLCQHHLLKYRLLKHQQPPTTSAQLSILALVLGLVLQVVIAVLHLPVVVLLLPVLVLSLVLQVVVMILHLPVVVLLLLSVPVLYQLPHTPHPPAKRQQHPHHPTSSYAPTPRLHLRSMVVPAASPAAPAPLPVPAAATVLDEVVLMRQTVLGVVSVVGLHLQLSFLLLVPPDLVLPRLHPAAAEHHRRLFIVVLLPSSRRSWRLMHLYVLLLLLLAVVLLRLTQLQSPLHWLLPQPEPPQPKLPPSAEAEAEAPPPPLPLPQHHLPVPVIPLLLIILLPLLLPLPLPAPFKGLALSTTMRAAVLYLPGVVRVPLRVVVDVVMAGVVLLMVVRSDLLSVLPPPLHLPVAFMALVLSAVVLGAVLCRPRGVVGVVGMGVLQL